MQRLRLVGAAVLVFGLVGACAEGPAATTTTLSTTTTTTSSTTTTLSTTTTTAPTTLAGPLLVDNPTGWEGNLVRLASLDGTAVADLATDRHWPWVALLTGDGSGGLLAVASPPPLPAGAVIRLAPGSLEPELAYLPEDGWQVVDVDALATMGDGADLVVLETRSTERREMDGVDDGAWIDVREWWDRVWLAPHGAPSVLLAEGSGRCWYEGVDIGGCTGDGVSAVSAGGDVVAVLRHDQQCEWVDFFDRRSSPLEIPALPVECSPRSPTGWSQPPALESAELSSDGRYLVARARDPEAVAIAVYRVQDGGEVGRIDGAWDHLYDGDRTILARTGDDRAVVATISDSGLPAGELDFDPMSEWPIWLLPGVTLAPDASFVVAASRPGCSAVGMDPNLPPIAGLPLEVEATRRRIAELATACDFAGLADLAARDPGFVLHEVNACGEPSPTIADLDPVGRWYRADLMKTKLRVLVETLSGEPELTDSWERAVGKAYVWRGPGYIIGITPDGTWRIDSVSPVEPCETMWCSC